MSEHKIIPLGKLYKYTLILLVIAGVLLTIVMAFRQEVNQVFVTGVVGTLIAVVICAIANLLYLLPSESLFIRLITPGLSVMILFVILFSSSQADLLYFSFFGIINLALGTFWYVSIKRLEKQA